MSLSPRYLGLSHCFVELPDGQYRVWKGESLNVYSHHYTFLLLVDPRVQDLKYLRIFTEERKDYFGK